MQRTKVNKVLCQKGNELFLCPENLPAPPRSLQPWPWPIITSMCKAGPGCQGSTEQGPGGTPRHSAGQYELLHSSRK